MIENCLITEQAHLLLEAKQGQDWLALGWGAAWEYRVLYA